MKWIISALLAATVALATPSLVMAQPGPGPMGGPGMGPMHGKGHGHGYGHDRHDKKKDKDRDDHHGYGPHPGMVPPPPPAPVPRPAPVVHHHHAPAPVPPPPVVRPVPVPPPVVRPVPVPPPVVYHPAPVVVVHEPVYAPVVRGMHPRDFKILVRSIEHATFSDDKLMVIRSARLNNFTSDQVRDILRHLDYDSTRIDAAVMLYPRVVDRSNWFIIYDTLDYSSSRREIEHQIRF